MAPSRVDPVGGTRDPRRRHARAARRDGRDARRGAARAALVAAARPLRSGGRGHGRVRPPLAKSVPLPRALDVAALGARDGPRLSNAGRRAGSAPRCGAPRASRGERAALGRRAAARALVDRCSCRSSRSKRIGREGRTTGTGYSGPLRSPCGRPRGFRRWSRSVSPPGSSTICSTAACTGCPTLACASGAWSMASRACAVGLVVLRRFHRAATSGRD